MFVVVNQKTNCWGIGLNPLCIMTHALLLSFNTGIVGGSFWTHSGAAVNYLCLTKQPEYDDVTKPIYVAYLYGSEYEEIGELDDNDVPCSVCRVPQSSTIMVPGTLTCPSGWTTQYKGHLAAGYPYHDAASEYVCLDGRPEGRPNSIQNQNGKLFYHAVGQCGSLPCLPYISEKVVTCVVCSK